MNLYELLDGIGAGLLSLLIGRARASLPTFKRLRVLAAGTMCGSVLGVAANALAVAARGRADPMFLAPFFVGAAIGLLTAGVILVLVDESDRPRNRR